MRTIMTSRLYQLDSQPTKQNAIDQQFYSHYMVKRLPAEPLLDAINTATGQSTVGLPLIEQFHVAGLLGDDLLEFATGEDALHMDDLVARSDDFVSVLYGGPGDDTLKGSEGRDRLDGGFGHDTLLPR